MLSAMPTGAVSPSPIALPANMPRERMEAFLKTVASRLRDVTTDALKADPTALAKTRANITTRIAEEQRLIAKAIGTESFAAAMADAYATQLANHQQGVMLAEARRETDSILRNRIVDCKNFVQLLLQPDFIAAAQALSLQPAPAPKPYALSASKIAEEVDSLVQPNRPTGPQPAVHVAMSARGHLVGHQALATIFAPKTGALCAQLVHALAGIWPNASGAEIEKLAHDWLKARHDPAHAISDALKPNGIIYTTAMAKAEQLQHARLQVSTPAPASTITAPVQNIGRLENPELALDNL